LSPEDRPVRRDPQRVQHLERRHRVQVRAGPGMAILFSQVLKT
jgi:hypothetical protein